MRHRFIMLFFLLFTFFWRGGAQVTVTEASFPAVGDTLFIAVDNLPSGIPVTPGGGNQRWDFSSLQSPFARRIRVQSPAEGVGNAAFPDANQLIFLDDNVEGYYRRSNSELQFLGIFGDDPLDIGFRAAARLESPITERRAPLRYLDASQEESDLVLAVDTDELPRRLLDQLPITPDSLRIRIHIDRQDEVDAWGKVIIPGGIFDVLREKRIEVRSTRLDAKIGILDWQDITDLIPDNDQLGTLTTVTHHYFSNEAKEPIAVITLDEDERNALRAEYKAIDITTNVQNVSNLKPGVYAFPNPAIVNVRFEFSHLPAGNYTLKIFNILGVEQWSQRYYISGSRTEKVNISDLRKGTYLYSLIDERGKTITTRRLIVIRP